MCHNLLLGGEKMRKLFVAMLMSGVLVFTAACGGGTAPTTAEGNTAQAEEGGAVDEAAQDAAAADAGAAEAGDVEAEAADASEAQEDPMVETIDLTYDEGSLKYVGFEKANEGLTEEENALVFKFDFTNNQTKPAQCQQVFRIQFFQNGAELTNSASWSSNGGDQYELVGAFYSSAMKGGTVTFGLIALPKDNSPITIMASHNIGIGTSDDYQMMEVDISSDGAAVEESPEEAEADAAEDSEDNEESADSGPSADEIDEMLQGEWRLEDGAGGTFYFDNGEITTSSQGMELNGTYEVNMDNSCIDAHFTANDGQKVTAHIPYKFDDDGNLVLMNNKNVEMTKQ